MSKSIALGGQRIGSGNKMNVSLKNYERSTHDLSRVFRTTMGVGTLVPFIVEPALPGDTFDINLDSLVRTMPTVGPLFGSFKLQIDLYSTPVRLYQSGLHMNLLGVGMDMKKLKLPIMEVEGRNPMKDFRADRNNNKGMFDQSSLLAYLGIRGSNGITNEDVKTVRAKNAIPLLAYWDIYKQYYANKQEDKAFFIGGGATKRAKNKKIKIVFKNGSIKESNIDILGGLDLDAFEDIEMRDSAYMDIEVITTATLKVDKYRRFRVYVNDNTGYLKDWDLWKIYKDSSIEIINDTTIRFTNNGEFDFIRDHNVNWIQAYQNMEYADERNPYIKSFDLKNIDEMKKAILTTPDDEQFYISDVDNKLEPYVSCVSSSEIDDESRDYYMPNNECTQNGLGLKTYNSDLFNNWLKTEWLVGSGSIAELTKVNTSDGSFTIDSLNLAKKVYDMLNRIAVSGGSYQDWQSAVYGEDTIRMSETPVYWGGMSREIVFEEIVSTAEVETNSSGNLPLGSLAGKGTQSQDKKGGNVTIKINEPSYIVGIVSITPRLDYNQGNKWFTEIFTMDDFHKPALDGIGFQDLITEQMAAWDTYSNAQDNFKLIQKSAGKQPAWINYMTAYNESYGDFADPNKLQFMTLCRQYEQGIDGTTGNTMKIEDLTTYINPTKFNFVFANTELSAMNFWVQIGSKITARRKMSAKIIPNL